MTELERARREAKNRYNERQRQQADQEQRMKRKRKHEKQAIHMDEYNIVQEYWNKEYGCNCVSIADAIQLVEHEKSSPSGMPGRRHLLMQQRIQYMQSLLNDQRTDEKRLATEQHAARKELEANQKLMNDIEKALRTIETLRSDERNIRHIRQAQHSKNILESLYDKLSDAQKARFEQAKNHAIKSAKVNLNRRFM